MEDATVDHCPVRPPELLERQPVTNQEGRRQPPLVRLRACQLDRAWARVDATAS